MTLEEIEYLKKADLLKQQEEFAKGVESVLTNDPQIANIGDKLGVDISSLTDMKQPKNLNQLDIDKLQETLEDEDKQSKMVANLVNSFLDKKTDNIDVVKLLSNYLNGGGKKGVKTKYLRKKKKKKK